MASGPVKGGNIPGPAGPLNVAKFLGNVPAGYTIRDQGGPEGGNGASGAPAGPSDARTIDPATIGQSAEPRPKFDRRAYIRAYQAKRRAAKAASGEAEKVALGDADKPPPNIDPTVIGQIAQALFGVHQMIALGLQSPEFALSEGDADALAKAIVNFGKYYVAIKVDSKTGALFALIITAGMIYVPRMMAVQARRAHEARERATSASMAHPSEGAAGMFADVMPPSMN